MLNQSPIALGDIPHHIKRGKQPVRHLPKPGSVVPSSSRNETLDVPPQHRRGESAPWTQPKGGKR